MPKPSRPSVHCHAALAALALALAGSPARAGSLLLSVERLPCANSESIAREVERRAAVHLKDGPHLVLVVAAQGPDALRLHLVGDGVSHVRQVPFRAQDCAELSHALYLIVRGWLDRDWAPREEPPEALAEDLRTPVAAENPAASLPPPPRPPLGTLAVLVAASLSPGLPRVAGSLSFEAAATPRLAIGLGLALHDALAGDLPPGRVEATQAMASLVVRARLLERRALGLEALAGPSLHHFQVRTRGFERPLPASFSDVGWTAGLRLRVPIGVGFSWALSAEAGARRRDEILRVRGVGEALHVSKWRAAVGWGVAFDIR